VSFTTDGRNHLSASTYDAAGNVATNNAYTYEYDALGSMNFLISSNESIPAGKVFLYGPSNDRIAVWDFKTGGVVSEAWSLRNAIGQVVRDVKRTDAGAWSWVKDYVYREGALMETIASTGTRHVTVDHLGTPRLLTDAANGSRVAFHTYLPYGSEATASTDGERIKFAGSERDENDTHAGTQGGDLDFMHARYYRATQGRFLALDPLGGDATNPQSWNRYAYVQDNPVNATDPTGRSIFDMVRMMRASAARQQNQRHSHRQHHQAKAPSQKGSGTPNRTWTVPQYDSDGTSCISPEAKASQEAARKQQEQQETKRKSDATACMNDAVCVANTWNLKKYDPNAPPEMSAITPLDEAMNATRELVEDEEDLEWRGELIRHNSHQHEAHEEGERMKNMEVHMHVMEMQRLWRERNELERMLEEQRK
jgi:RHS repeat-associated protein